MFCRNCGNEIKNGEKICDKCGYNTKTGKLETIVNEHTESCKSCVKNITEEEYKKYNGYCKNCYFEINDSKKAYDRTTKPKKNKVILKFVVYILAIVVVIMFFDGADEIHSAAYKMSNLKSVGGSTVAEHYYQYYGTFLYGLETVVKALGITAGIFVAYVAKKINIYEEK